MKITLKRKNQAFHYEAENDEHLKVNIDANPAIGGEGKGVRPMQLVLMGLAGCASIDLALILKKQRQELVDYEVEVNATRDEEPPKAFKTIHIHFVLTGNLDANKVEKAIELTLTKYCSVSMSLNKEIEVTSSFEIK